MDWSPLPRSALHLLAVSFPLPAAGSSACHPPFLTSEEANLQLPVPISRCDLKKCVMTVGTEFQKIMLTFYTCRLLDFIFFLNAQKGLCELISLDFGITNQMNTFMGHC